MEDADFTNSPCSFNLARTSLLVTPSSFASSCTRALPATALLVRVRPAACTRATSSYCLTFMASASRLTHDGSTCFRCPARPGWIPVRSRGEPAAPDLPEARRCRAVRRHVTLSRTRAVAQPCSCNQGRDESTRPGRRRYAAGRVRDPRPRSRPGATHQPPLWPGSPRRYAPGWCPLVVPTQAGSPVHDDEPLMSLSRPPQSAEPDAGATGL